MLTGSVAHIQDVSRHLATSYVIAVFPLSPPQFRSELYTSKPRGFPRLWHQVLIVDGDMRHLLGFQELNKARSKKAFPDSALAVENEIDLFLHGLNGVDVGNAGTA